MNYNGFQVVDQTGMGYRQQGRMIEDVMDDTKIGAGNNANSFAIPVNHHHQTGGNNNGQQFGPPPVVAMSTPGNGQHQNHQNHVVPMRHGPPGWRHVPPQPFVMVPPPQFVSSPAHQPPVVPPVVGVGNNPQSPHVMMPYEPQIAYQLPPGVLPHVGHHPPPAHLDHNHQSHHHNLPPGSVLSAEEEEKWYGILSGDDTLKDDISSFLEDSLADGGGNTPGGNSNTSINNSGTAGNSHSGFSLLQKMAQDDDQSEILSDLLMNNNFSRNSTPAGGAGNTSASNNNNSPTPESMMMGYGEDNTVRSNSVSSSTQNYNSVKLSDFESPAKRENIDPKKIKINTPGEGSVSPADLFDFELGQPASKNSSSSNNNGSPVNSINSLSSMKPVNGSVTSMNAVNPVGPLSPNKITKGFKPVMPPTRPFDARPRSPSSSSSPQSSVRKSTSSKKQKPKPKRTFSLDHYSTTLDFSKEATPSKDSIPTTFNPAKHKSYSFVMEEPLPKMLAKETKKSRAKKLSIEVDKQIKEPLVSPTFSQHSLESPLQTPGSGNFKLFAGGFAGGYIDSFESRMDNGDI